MKVGLVVQARYNSTRLPGKVLRSFYKDKTMLETLVDRFIDNLKLPIVIATSIEKEDDKIVELCKKNKYVVYRGSENDVLERFIDAAEKFDFTHVIRVCSDNPFILPSEIKRLADEARKNPDKDYISFKIDETPSILTHYGLWAELIKVKSLKLAANSCDKLYREHVTNYFYSNPDMFNLLWLQTDKQLSKIKTLRLTVDDEVDFKNAQFLMDKIGIKFSLNTIISNVKRYPELLLLMDNQIKKHQK
ncbi:MAG: glycosyl transferase family 2 [Bacteroidales bacterium]|nr:glycosyl transferase family 2 [Bacteroidales bacterium]